MFHTNKIDKIFWQLKSDLASIQRRDSENVQCERQEAIYRYSQEAQHILQKIEQGEINK